MNAPFTLCAARPQRGMRSAHFHQWLLPEGDVSARFYRIAGGYLVRFPSLADFEVSADAGKVDCYPARGVGQDQCRQLYAGQVLPLLISKRGKLVFHASAVEVASGAVAFVGRSGAGKSTLAALFAVAGYRFLTDDSLIADAGRHGYTVLAGQPSLRLWDDSREALIGAGSGDFVAHRSGKMRLPTTPGMAFCPRARRLRSAYFIGEGSARAVVIRPLAASEAFVRWLRHSFLLDPHESSGLAAQFEGVAQLANGVPGYVLDYPRDFAQAAAIRDAVISHQGSVA